eukprot:TRINITY_DN1488_c0_g1_i1.p1 TRINITY_DN1488_c0_g1~~TRINITY_DN1488_c0_g1_i1.p1  ORF type:complete len:1046 (+),score=227.50 TRINITY_DN1488_c0_g1_i1:60-3197(+)
MLLNYITDNNYVSTEEDLEFESTQSFNQISQDLFKYENNSFDFKNTSNYYHDPNEYIFNIYETSIDFNILDGDIISIEVSSNILFILTTSFKLYRIPVIPSEPGSCEKPIVDWERRRQHSMIPHNNGKCVLKKIFAHPEGKQVLVSANCCTYYFNFEYLDNKSTIIDIEPINKFINDEITSVSWLYDYYGPISFSNEVLVGTNDGNLFVVKFEKKLKAQFQFLLKLPLDDTETRCISGVQWLKVENSHTFFVCTSSYIFTFQGGPKWQDAILAKEVSKKHIVSNSIISHSAMHLYHPSYMSFGNSFAFLFGQNVLHGTVSDVDGLQNTKLTLLNNVDTIVDMLSFSNTNNDIPKHVFCTSEHFIVVYDSTVRAYNLQSGLQPINVQLFHPKFKTSIVDCSYDVLSASAAGVIDLTKNQLITPVQYGRYWIATADNVYEIVPTNEKKDLWQIYFGLRDYESALQEVGNDIVSRGLICEQLGLQQWEMNKTTEALENFANSKIPLSQVQVFISRVDSDSITKSELIIQYIKAKLASEYDPPTAAQRIVLVHLLFDELLDLIISVPKEQEQKYIETCLSFLISDDFKPILEKSSRRIVNRLSEVDLIDSLLIPFVEHIKQFDYLIYFLFQTKQYSQLLDQLKWFVEPMEKRNELYKLYMPFIFMVLPDKVINVIRHDEDFDPQLMIPTFISLTTGNSKTEQLHAAIEYVELIFDGDVFVEEDKLASFANLLLGLYVRLADSNRFTDFIRTHSEHINLGFALQLSQQFDNPKQITSNIFLKLGNLQTALDDALSCNDFKTAKAVANSALIFEEKRNLWLKYAKKLIKTKRDGLRIKDLLRDSGCLTIEDLLPLISDDTTTINKLKRVILDSIEAFNEDLVKAREATEEATDALSYLQNKEFESIKDHKSNLELKDQHCCICNKNFNGTKAICFPCGHVLHPICITKFLRLVRIQDPARYNQITLFKEMDEKRMILEETHKVEDERKLLDVLSRDCPMCGNIAIDQIDEPLFMKTDVDYSNDDIVQFQSFFLSQMQAISTETNLLDPKFV